MSGKPEELGPVYYRVSPAYWMNRSWTDDMRLLGLYLLTSPHRSLEGLCWLPKQYVCGDLQWPAERLHEPFAKLLEDEFLGYDDAAEVLLIVRALKYQSPVNPNMRTAVLRRVQTVPQTPLDERFLSSADEFCEPLAELLRERLPKRFGKPSPFLNLDSPPVRAPAREEPVDNCQQDASPVDNSHRRSEVRDSSKSSEPDQTLPEVPVSLCGPIAHVVGTSRVDELLREGSDLNTTVARFIARVDALVEKTLAEAPEERRTAARERCRRVAFDRIAASHAAQVDNGGEGIRNLPAYLTKAAKTAVLGDLVGDDLVRELRARPKRGKSEPRRLADLAHETLEAAS